MMVEELVECWNSLKITKDEAEVVEDPSMIREEVKLRGDLCLLGKVIADKMVNIKVMHTTMYNAWNLSRGVKCSTDEFYHDGVDWAGMGGFVEAEMDEDGIARVEYMRLKAWRDEMVVEDGNIPDHSIQALIWCMVQIKIKDRAMMGEDIGEEKHPNKESAKNGVHNKAVENIYQV
ncbi:hypothetical protein ACH5RR_003550 [Cinchona calisaya]|uniref:Uncharacterized protein n=1 Tax=Cinchona calisaya TaxID=153742 RepID=A0ABD3AV73_9GENT